MALKNNLIKCCDKKGHKVEHSITKVAIICNTPWQVLGAINIVVNNVEESTGNTDIFIINDFSGANQVCNQLKKETIFNKVVFCSKLDEKKKPAKWKTLKRLIFPKTVFKEYKVNDKYIAKNRYKKIFVGDGNLLGVAIKNQNKNSDFFLYDDGIDTYIGNSLMDGKSRIYKLIAKTLHIGKYSYQIKKLYVNCKMFCKSLVSKNIEELPKLNEHNSTVQIAKRIFQFSECSLLLSYRFIVLGQPLEERKGYNSEPFEALYPEKKLDLFLVRKHPRQKVINYGSIMYDSINNMWELECIFNINNKHVLISFYSTP